MTPQPQQNGIVINKATISAIVGLIAIFGAFYTASNKISSYEHRLNQIEINDGNRNREIQTLTGELRILTQKLTDLTIELREMRAEQKAKQR